MSEKAESLTQEQFVEKYCEGKQYDSCKESPCPYASHQGCKHPRHPDNVNPKTDVKGVELTVEQHTIIEETFRLHKGVITELIKMSNAQLTALQSAHDREIKECVFCKGSKIWEINDYYDSWIEMPCPVCQYDKLENAINKEIEKQKAELEKKVMEAIPSGKTIDDMIFQLNKGNDISQYILSAIKSAFGGGK